MGGTALRATLVVPDRQVGHARMVERRRNRLAGRARARPPCPAVTEEAPTFPSAPPERIELSASVALVRCRAERAAAAVAAINASLDHLWPWMAWASEPATEAGLATFFAAAEELWDQRKDFGYSIVDADDAVLGGCGLHGRLGRHRPRDRLLGARRPHRAGPRHRRLGRAHGCRLRHRRHRAGADPVRGAQRPQRPGAGEARLRASRACRVPDDGPCDGTAHAAVADRPGDVDRGSPRRPGRSLARWTTAPSGCSTAASVASPSPGR